MFHTCSATRPDGTPCQNVATSTGLCPACFRLQQGRKDGRFGLAPEYHKTYEQFQAEAEGNSLGKEVALIKVLILRCIETIEQRSQSNYRNFLNAVYTYISSDLTRNLKMPEDQANLYGARFMQLVQAAFISHIGDLCSMSVKEAKDITGMLSQMAKLLETQKKLEEAAQIQFEIDEDLIRQLFNHIMPHLPPEYRRLIAELLRNFARGKIRGIELEDFSSEPIDAEFTWTPEMTALVPAS